MNNLEMMRKRFEWQGGIHQEDRMIRDKQRTLHRALLYSYQAVSIEMVQKFDKIIELKPSGEDPDMEVYGEIRALINPDKVKQDYDDKIVSLDYEHGYEPGDVFEWKRTDTHWLIYTQELTEDAYFRGEIRRCRYMIKFKDQDGNWCATYAAIRGPVETQINSIQKNQQRIDTPNLSLNILMPRNEQTLHAFDRYSEFIFAGKCWRVEAPDSISMKNIIEINAEENYWNDTTDDLEKEMKDGLVFEPINPTPDTTIIGETFIKPKIAATYSVEVADGEWKILEDVPACVKATGNQTATVTWNKTTSGQFTLQWVKGNDVREKVIVVESLY